MKQRASLQTVLLVMLLLPAALPCWAQITDAQEVEAGKQGLQDMIAAGEVTLSNDAKAKQRLERLGERIARAAGRPGLGWAGGWKWMPATFAAGPNAAGCPGGFVLVDTRLLATLQNDDEVAFVLAHEAGHVVGRHLFRTLFNQGTVKSWLTEEAAKLIEKYIDALLAQLLRGELKYSRELEYEADERGMAIMQRAGFDTKAPLRWMAREIYMSSDLAFLQVWQRYMEDHPPWTDRADHLRVYKEQVLDKGPFLAFVRDHRLWVSRWDGTDQRPTALSGMVLCNLVWSPQGDALALCCEGNIFAVRANDLSVIRLTGSGRAEDPVWVPSGDSIICISQGDVYLISRDTREKKRLTTTGDCSGPSVSSDGSRVVYQRSIEAALPPSPPEVLGGVVVKSRGVWTVTTRTGQARQVSEDLCGGLQFSPDGTWLSYSSGVGDDPYHTCAHLIPLGSETTKAVALDDAWGIRWAPGSQRLLVFVGKREADGLNIFDLKHSRWERTAGLGGGYAFEALPNRTWTKVAVLASGLWGPPQDRGPQRMWAVEYPNLQCTRVSPDPARKCPDTPLPVGWTPDAQVIIGWVPVSGGRGELWLVPLDGAPWRRLVDDVDAVDAGTASEPWPYVL